MVDLWFAVRLTLALSGSLWPSLALSGSLWLALLLSLAPSCSLKLPICLQSPRLAHKAIAQLAAALLRCMNFCWSGANLFILVTKDIRHVSCDFLPSEGYGFRSDLLRSKII